MRGDRVRKLDHMIEAVKYYNWVIPIHANPIWAP